MAPEGVHHVIEAFGIDHLGSSVKIPVQVARMSGQLSERLARRILQYRADCDAWAMLTVYGPRSTKELSSLPSELDHWYTFAMNEEHPSSHSPAVRKSLLRAAAAGVSRASHRLWASAQVGTVDGNTSPNFGPSHTLDRFSLSFPSSTEAAFQHFSAWIGALQQLLLEAVDALAVEPATTSTTTAAASAAAPSAVSHPHAFLLEDAAGRCAVARTVQRFTSALHSSPAHSAAQTNFPNSAVHSSSISSRACRQGLAAAAPSSTPLPLRTGGMPRNALYRRGEQTRQLTRNPDRGKAHSLPVVDAFGGAFTVRALSLSRRAGHSGEAASSSRRQPQSSRSASAQRVTHETPVVRGSGRLKTCVGGSTATLSAQHRAALGAIGRFLLACALYRQRHKRRLCWLHSVAVLPVSLSSAHLGGLVPAVMPALPALWGVCRGLTHLCFRGMHCIGNKEITTACSALPSLEWLDIACTAADDSALPSVCALPRLRVLQLGGLRGLTDQGLQVITARLRSDRSDTRSASAPPHTPLLLPLGASSRTVLGQRELHCAPLLGLDLADCRSISDAGMYDLGRAALGLMDLSLYGASQLSNECLLGFGSRDHRLRRLNTAGAYKITQGGTHMLFSTASDLELYNDPGDFWGGFPSREGPPFSLHTLLPCPSVLDAMRVAPPGANMRGAMMDLHGTPRVAGASLSSGAQAPGAMPAAAAAAAAAGSGAGLV